MKYGKELGIKLRVLPWYVRMMCIDYKLWKKMPLHCCGGWIHKLMWDCYKCETLNKTYANDTINKMNVQTLYKVCKRLQKRYDIPAMMVYTRILKSNQFKFIGEYKEFI